MLQCELDLIVFSEIRKPLCEHISHPQQCNLSHMPASTVQVCSGSLGKLWQVWCVLICKCTHYGCPTIKEVSAVPWIPEQQMLMLFKTITHGEVSTWAVYDFANHQNQICKHNTNPQTYNLSQLPANTVHIVVPEFRDCHVMFLLNWTFTSSDIT